MGDLTVSIWAGPRYGLLDVYLRCLTAAKMLGIDVPTTITKGTFKDLISVFGRDGIFNQIPIRGTNMIIDMFGRLVK